MRTGPRTTLLAAVCVAALAAACSGAPVGSPAPAPVATPTAATVPTDPGAPRATPARPTASLAASALPQPPSGLSDELLSPGQLVICSAFPRARYAEYDAAGRPFGIDIDVGRAIAERLELEPTITEHPFEDLIDAVVGSECDLAIAGHFITQERLAVIDLVPYREGSVNVVVPAGNPLGIAELDDLCGRTVAIVGGTIYVDILRGQGEYAGRGVEQQCEAAGLEPITLAEHVSETDAVADLAGGDADAFVGNEAVAVERPADFALSEAQLPRLRNGIGHLKGAAALDTALRTALRGLIADGTYAAILERYGAGGIELTELP